ncbi:MAG: hypothetical protein E6Q38_01050 [Crocinitomicaceae bacterium]|nr:MAG: hypothetical protein E6Q38_01050 [Crocinitomicaceae bacterium]
MKLFLILITFFAFSVGAQETKPKFFQQIYLEPNVGVGLFHTFSIYQDERYIIPAACLGLTYKTNKFKVGLDMNYCFDFEMFSPRIQTSYNLSNLNKHPRQFTGPLIGVGLYKEPNHKGSPYLTIGLDNYFRNFHFAIKCDIIKPGGAYDYIQRASFLYFELGYAIHLGKKNKKTQE